MELNSIRFDLVPHSLRAVDQWIHWKSVVRDGKPTKVPIQLNGLPAKSNDRTTWSPFADAVEGFSLDSTSGIGFVFSPDDPFVGVDLDGCRNPETGKVEEWAREIILKFSSYAEVSPSKTGIKIFCSGTMPFAGGKKIELPEAPRCCDKQPALEVYDRGRYFAVTGWRVKGPAEPQERQEALDWLKAKFWPDEPKPTAAKHDFHSQDAIVERARKYLAKLPAAVSGQGGHNATFHAACVLVLGFDLAESDAIGLMHEFNQRCDPPWSEKEIARKVREAGKQTGQRGYLKNTAPANWGRVPVPQYEEPPQTGPRITTLVEATRGYVQSIRDGKTSLISLGIPELDYAHRGGVEPGELVIFAARPSHGKSMAALQCVHSWTAAGMPCVIISEEMSARMLGRRTLQFLSKRPEEHWRDEANLLDSDIDAYAAGRKDCIVIESCGTTQKACEEIERAVKESGVRCGVVDYAQLLRAPGKSRYEQVTNTSIMLRQLASRTGIVLLVLCQLSRAVEQRPGGFLPVTSDLKETGQLEQDADVISLLCWPCKVDPEQPANKYQFFNVKNRNRGINESITNCRFIPSRQMIAESTPEQDAESAPNPFANQESNYGRYGSR